MTRLIQLVIVVLIFGLSQPSVAFGTDEPEKKPWKVKLGDGTEITESELQKIVGEHKFWVESGGKQGKLADLKGADLNQANLSDADLRGADLSRTNLFRANLSRAILFGANLSWANLVDANLSNATLVAANLSNANISGADLTGCELYLVSGFPLPKLGAGKPDWKDFDPFVLPVYEPKAGSVPDIPSMAGLANLEQLTYIDYPHGLVDLREGFKKLGYREQERKITYALKHTETKALLNSGNLFGRIEGWLRLYLFEYTSNWGMSPGRPLFILLGIMFLFSFVYMFSLIGINKRDGIWKVWIPDRVRSDLGKAESKKPLNCPKAYQIGWYGFYFSLLSAFNIGWRELNVGNWIARVQPREYTLRASGWVRTVSGIQSLISVYLLALAVLTYFGRPFDQY